MQTWPLRGDPSQQVSWAGDLPRALNPFHSFDNIY